MRYFILILSLLLTISPISAQEQTPYDIALARILEAEASGATELDLSELGLTELPPEIGNLANLETLRLYRNELSSLPPEIGNLVNLRFLSLSFNNLTSLPSEVGNLANLSSLRLAFNDLNSLPSEIGNLTNLTYLDLAYNELNRLPSEIGNLAKLCNFDLSDNRLLYLSISLAQLSNLEANGCRFDLSYNPLIYPPENVIAQGIPAFFDYYGNQVSWHFQSLMLSVLRSLAFAVVVILGLRHRQRNQRKPKQKRGNVS
ncbi:MAG: hypothetical protein Phog2KO_38810 [Phototrophicaceae bacterium]